MPVHRSLIPYGLAVAFLLIPCAAADTYTLDFDASVRMRYETLDRPVRRDASGADRLLVSQILLHGRVIGPHLFAGIELADSRATLDDDGTPLGTDDVNTLELLRAYIGLRRRDVFQAGDELDIRGGRLTLNLGSRRLIARNQFRNTINAFTGLQSTWRGAHDDRLTAFAILPIERAPDERRRLAANERAFDSERLQTALFGLVGRTRRLPGAAEASAYLYVLEESDDGSRLTRDRRLFTPGLRLWRTSRPGRWDGEVEIAAQIGRSRANALAEDMRDLDHRAGFMHLHIGRTLDRPSRPRVALEFDYASGDGDPADRKNGHFDTLYGARRFEYGPTGIFGPFARANLIIPGARFEFAPHERLTLMLGYRAAWLARRRDAMDGTNLRDPSGRSGRYIGQQVETRLRWNAIADRLHLEAGAAHLFHGRFLRSAPGAPDEGDSTYLYLQTTVSY